MTDRQFAMTLDLAASAQQVWQALTSAEELSRWFAPVSKVTPGASGEILLEWGESVVTRCAITHWDPPRQLTLDWPEGEVASSSVSFSISGAGGASSLRLVHAGFGVNDEAVYQSVARGWTIETLILRHYLQRFRGTDRYMRMSATAVPDMDAGRWRALAQRWSMPDPIQIRQGQHFPIEMPEGLSPGAVLLQGIVDQDLLIELDALNGGLLRIGVETSNGQPQLWLWVMDWNGQFEVVDQIFTSLEEGIQAVIG